MPRFDLSHFKQALAAARDRERAQTGARPTKSSPRAVDQRYLQSLEQLIKQPFARAGLDTAKLDTLRSERQKELRQLFQKEKAEAAKAAAVQKAAFHRAVDEGWKALQYLRNPPVDVGFGLSSLVTLPAPFLIWEWPLDQSLISTHLEPLRSRARILLDIPIYSMDNDSGSEKREYSFYFLWENASSYLAVVKCFSVLGLNGACELYANSGVFSGDSTSLWIDAYLYPIAYWMPLAPGSDIRSLRVQGDPLQHASILNGLTAEGGGLFGSSDTQGKTFSAVSAGVSYSSFGGLQIPGGATALFEVNLTLNASWSGNTLPDEAIVDFANESLQYSVECPLVVLQFLTQPPAAA